MKVGIIGGGPAGMFAALEAVKKGFEVTILDNNPVLGRKLSVTGGSRGNLTNLDVRAGAYFSQNKQVNARLGPILAKYGADYLINYLSQLGIPTYHTDDGWVYPISNSAKNLSIYLSSLLTKNKVNHIAETFIEDFKIQSDCLSLYDSKRNSFRFNHVVFATGGSSYPQLGASSNILKTLNKNGYQTFPIYPALAPVKTTKTATNLLKGLRFNAQLRLCRADLKIAEEYGNVIFTEWGLNGPGVMNLSHYCNVDNKNLTLTINPLINNKKVFKKLLNDHPNQDLKLSVFLLSFLPEGLINQYHKNENKYIDLPLHQVSRMEIDTLIKCFNLQEEVTGTREFKYSQLSTGGIKLNQVDLNTMRSKLHPNISFAGEIFDIIGPCGGFNLHWAFISGLIAGMRI